MQTTHSVQALLQKLCNPPIGKDELLHLKFECRGDLEQVLQGKLELEGRSRPSGEIRSFLCNLSDSFLATEERSLTDETLWYENQSSQRARGACMVGGRRAFASRSICRLRHRL